jgi:hypothetical protein
MLTCNSIRRAVTDHLHFDLEKSWEVLQKCFPQNTSVLDSLLGENALAERRGSQFNLGTAHCTLNFLRLGTQLFVEEGT